MSTRVDDVAFDYLGYVVLEVEGVNVKLEIVE